MREFLRALERGVSVKVVPNFESKWSRIFVLKRFN